MNNNIPAIKRDELFAQLGNIINLHNDEHQTWLRMFFTSLTTNALLFIALFRTGDFPCNPFVARFIAFLGCLFTMMFSRVQNRALEYMNVYEKLAKKIENELKLGEYSYTFKLKEAVSSTPSARRYMKAFNYFIIGVWILIFIYSIITACGDG